MLYDLYVSKWLVPAPALLALVLWAGCLAPAPALQQDLGGADDGPRMDLPAADCADDLGDRALGGACVHTVSGRLIDEQGGPVAGAVVTVCAAACFTGKTIATGAFSVPVNQYIQVGLYSLLAHVNPRRAAFYMSLPQPAAGQIALEQPVMVLPMPADGPIIRDDRTAQIITSGGVTLTIEAGTDLFFSFEDTADMPLGARLRPLRFDTFDKLPFLGTLQPAALYAFGPFEADFKKPVRLSFDNTTGLPAGTPIEVLGQRGLLHGNPPGARFDRVATAQVSADGKRIDMDSGMGIGTLTWIALRKKEN